MTTNSCNACGVLTLDRVTPVISALFRPFNLDPERPGPGRACISELSQAAGPQWSAVFDPLIELAIRLNLEKPEVGGINAAMPLLLRTLAQHFGQVQNMALIRLIDGLDFADPITLEDLFHLATCFDDGHNLVSIEFQYGWQSGLPSHFACGGAGCYISREVGLVTTSSSDALLFGQQLRNAILFDDLETAARQFAAEVWAPLRSIADASFRTRLRRRIFELMLDDLLSPNAG